MNPGLLRPIILAALLALPLSLPADTIETLDGSRLNGRVVAILDGTVTIETDFAGSIEIPQEQIATLSIEEPVYVSRTDGSQMLGTVEKTAGQPVRVNSQDGEMTAPIDGVAALWRPDAPSPQDRAFEAQQRKWRYELSAGFDGKTGNSEAKGVDFRARAELEGPEDQLSFRAQYRFSEIDDQKEFDDAMGSISYQREITEDFLWYIRTKLGRDDLKELNLFTQTAGGVGYEFLESENHNLTVLAGIGHRFESFNTGVDESFAATDFNLMHDYTYKWLNVFTEINYPRGLNFADEYAIDQESGIEVPLGYSDHWNLRLGVENQYDGNPSPGTNRHDLIYFSRIIFEFEED